MKRGRVSRALLSTMVPDGAGEGGPWQQCVCAVLFAGRVMSDSRETMRELLTEQNEQRKNKANETGKQEKIVEDTFVKVERT